MPSSVDSILRLDLPIIVRMGEKTVRAKDVTALQPGSIIELPKSAEDPLELLVNNKCVGTGHAVKVGENFGIKLDFIGDIRTRIEAMGKTEPAPSEEPPAPESVDAEAVSEMLSADQDT